MNLLAFILVLVTLPGGIVASQQLDSKTKSIRIEHLTIESKTLSQADLIQVVKEFEGRTFAQEELGPRIEIAFQNLGYFKAVVNDPRISSLPQDNYISTGDAIVQVEEGEKYHLREIQIRNSDLFPADQVRKLFNLQMGDVFARDKIAKGISDLRELYVAQGYFDCEVLPETNTDDTDATIVLILTVEKGRPFSFGRLVLDGIEPHPGSGKALLRNWAELKGKRYDPQQLQEWFLRNKAYLPQGVETETKSEISVNLSLATVNVKVIFPDR